MKRSRVHMEREMQPPSRKRLARLVPRLATLALAGLLAASCQNTNVTEALSVEPSSETWKGPQAGLLAPFKERGFAYRTPLEVSDGGRFMRIPYEELVDINRRDEIPVRKVKSWYVSRLPAGAEVERQYSAGGRTLPYRAIGALDGGSKLTIIYFHGRGGNKDWGFDDERFGGNFNRLKNMILKAGGAYLSPGFTDFAADGVADAKALVAKYRPLTSGKLVISCGSLGNTICWELAQDPASAQKIDGIVMLAGFPDNRFFSSQTARSAARHIPLVIAHGSSDPDYSYEPTLEFFRRLRKEQPSYPVRYLLFDTGTHGAPVRMIDWRDTLNWIAAR
jgi:hypothetical protein